MSKKKKEKEIAFLMYESITKKPIVIVVFT